MRLTINQSDASEKRFQSEDKNLDLPPTSMAVVGDSSHLRSLAMIWPVIPMDEINDGLQEEKQVDHCANDTNYRVLYISIANEALHTY